MANYFYLNLLIIFRYEEIKKYPINLKNPISVVIAYRDSGQGPEGHTTVARLE